MAVAKTSVTWQCKLLSESRTGWCLEMDTLGGVIWHTKPVKCISIEQTQELWEISNSLITETLSSFTRHMSNCDTCYIFKNLKTKQIVGFSLWRCRETEDPHIKVISQGKLRITRDYRRRSLHVIAGLRFYFAKQWQFPRASFYFLSIAALFNYVSMSKGVRDFVVMLEGNSPPSTKPLSYLYGQLTEHMREEGFDYAPNGSINVHIKLKPEVLQEYPEEYYQLPTAADYIRKNPNWKDGYDLAYMYPFTLVNVIYLVWRVMEHVYRLWKYRK